jgi:hypothetical protein
MRWTISRINTTKKQLFFNGALLIVLESVCQFAISAYLYVVRPNEEFNENDLTFIAQKFTAYFCLIMLIIVTIASIIILFIDEEYLM